MQYDKINTKTQMNHFKGLLQGRRQKMISGANMFGPLYRGGPCGAMTCICKPGAPCQIPVFGFLKHKTQFLGFSCMAL